MSGAGEPKSSGQPLPLEPEEQPSSAVTSSMYEESDETVQDFRDLDLYRTWKERMQSENDMIICIAASSRTEMSGTGKSTLAVQLGRAFDCSDSPFDAGEQASLSADEVAKEYYPNLPKGSAIIFDEAQGTLGEDGVDNRRSMADAVVKMSRSAAQHRWKQMTLIIVTQSTRWIDSRMMELIDRLILIQEKNHHQGWARAVIFDHYFDDLASDKQEYTPAVEDIYWRPLPKDDPDYQKLHELKEKSDGTGSPSESKEEEDSGVPDISIEQRNKLLKERIKNEDVTEKDLAKTFGITRQRVNQIVNE